MEAPDWSSAPRAYDVIASRYDRIPLENRINRFMRRISLAHLRETFRPGSRLIEIGCGTGEEALALAQAGIRVFALDPSEEMIRIARRKAKGLGLADEVQFIPGNPLEVLGGWRENESLDGGYASFSLAYEPDLAALSAALARILPEDARFVASLPSRFCLVEFLAALLTGRPSYTGARLRSWHWHKVGDRCVPIRTYNLRALSEVMRPHFIPERVRALPALVPPPYANRWYVRFPWVADALESLDLRIQRLFPFRHIGDHLLIDFRRAGFARGRGAGSSSSDHNDGKRGQLHP